MTLCLLTLLSALALSAQPADPAAIKQLQDAARLSPSDAEVHGRLGIAYRKLGMADKAIESFERAIRLQPDARVKVLLAFSYMDAGRFQDAIPLLSASFESEQKESVKSAVGQRLVECYLATQSREQALPVVNQLRQMAPDDPAVLYLASRVYMDLWNDAFQRLLVKTPGSHQVHLIQAEALEAQDRFDEAAHHYREILKSAPQMTGIHYRLGVAILRSGSAASDQQALAEFQKEIAIDPASVAALTAAAEIHLSNGRRQEALRSFSRAIELQPGHVPAKVGLAKVLIAEKQWSGALEQLEAAAKLAPYVPAVHYNLMLAYRALGRDTDAKQAGDTFQRLKESKGAASK